MVVEGLKLILDTKDARESFLAAVEVDAEFEATKVALALKIQRASQSSHAEVYALDEAAQAAWGAIVDDMVDCRFEGRGGNEALVAAIRRCLSLTEGTREGESESGGESVAGSTGSTEQARASIASALRALRFVEEGLGAGSVNNGGLSG